VHVERDGDQWTVAIREGADYTGQWSYDNAGAAATAALHLLGTAGDDVTWHNITAAYQRSA
jgi:hypothetical protein